MNKKSLPYILPFAIYLAFSIPQNASVFIYPVKITATAIALLFFRRSYEELRNRPELKKIIGAVITGVVVFFVWITPAAWYPHLGQSSYNPTDVVHFELLVIARIVGAVLIVPIFEELFWRSYLLRWIINSDFKKIAIGRFSWPSFLIVICLFGVEHHRWFVGILAGIIYNLLLYKQKNIVSCVIAHAVTNLLLGLYVMYTHQWGYW